MTHSHWASFDLIFFDCDSTLSAIEGIDELARLKGKEWRVSVLTDKAMNGDLDLAQVYGKRLQAIRPTRGQLKAVEEMYWEKIVPDAEAVLAALHYLGKEVFIISGGLAEPVRGFGKRLGVPPEKIRAVELEYNQLAGDWWHYYEPQTQNTHTYLDYQVGPLTISSGKPTMVRELVAGRPGRKLMVGDGMSDLVTRTEVDLFVGFGGVVSRAKVRDNAEAFIDSPSLAPILPVAVGPVGYQHVKGTIHQPVFDKGIELALNGALSLNNLRDDFERAFAT